MTDFSSPSSILESVTPRQRAVELAIASGDSDIQRFYQDTVVLLTGFTGFLGKQLLEKLFRSTTTKKIFVLMRPKKGKSVRERLEDILKDPVYDTLRKKKPDFKARIVCVEGDVGEPRLGISDQDWCTIIEEVEVIFHMAATTKFDEALKVATFINVRGTREMLDLGRACKKLRSYVHASTAFSHTTTSRINKPVLEQFYPCPVPPAAMILMAETMQDERFYGAAVKLMEDWPNTYTFTKALGEEIVRTMSGNLPVCIVRPPYVMSTYYDPVPGWIDSSCVYGPSGILIAAGLGIMHVTLNKADLPLAYCPADFVNNAMMAAGVACGARLGTGDEGIEPVIYSLVNTDTCIRWEEQSRFLRSKVCRKLATPKALWSIYLFETESSFMYWLLTWILHYIPGYILDCICFITGFKIPGKETSFVKLYSKMFAFGTTFKHFLTNTWHFDSTNLQQLYDTMSERDKVIYNFDVKSIDWSELSYIWLIGLRKYVVKDGLVEDGSGCRKQIWLYCATYIFFAVYIFAAWQIMSWLLTLILYFSDFLYVLFSFYT